MNKKAAISLLFSATVVAIALNVPRLPSPRYSFKDVEKKDTYSNLQFSTLIFDNWTGEVCYVAEGRYEDTEMKDKPRFVATKRILNDGIEPTQIFLERKLLLLAIGATAAIGVHYFSKPETT